MGYLELASGVTDFNKAVFSLWFRIPSASITAARSLAPSPNSDEWQSHVIPLITFGRKQSQVTWASSLTDVLTWGDTPPDHSELIHFYQTIYSGSSSFSNYLPPCGIGVDCSGSTAKLLINLQTEVTPSIVGNTGHFTSVVGYTDSIDAVAAGKPVPTVNGDGSGWVDASYIQHFISFVDTSYSDTTYPVNLAALVNDKNLAGDTWHHLLVSFDLSAGIIAAANPYPNSPYANASLGHSAVCKMWVAIDDTNYSGTNNLTGPSGFDGIYVTGGGANDITTRVALAIATADNTPPLVSNLLPANNQSYNSGSLSVPAGSASIGIPAPVYYEGNILKVEMTELQIYTGVSLDTSVTANRRAFIDASRKPVSSAAAISLLGQSPDVLFHTAVNWEAGHNTGTGGQFIRTGTIVDYSPGP